MSDILREVDEELRRERYQKLWERYGIYVVGAALALVDTASASEIARRLDPLIAGNSAFKASAREILALARFRAGERDAARRLFIEIVADPESPPSLRSRAQLMLALLPVDAALATQ